MEERDGAHAVLARRLGISQACFTVKTTSKLALAQGLRLDVGCDRSGCGHR
jgi:hypothetical protein